MSELYKVGTFKVTETCNNGKERTFKKKVYFSPFTIGCDGRQYNRTDWSIEHEGIALLKSKWYYNIEFIGVSVERLEVVR